MQKLVYYGNKTLRNTADEVKNIDDKTLGLIDTMFNIMYKEKGIGLAAPQVDVGKKIIVIDVSMVKGPSIALLNPEIIHKSEECVYYDEGCLSLPGISGNIFRPSSITVKGVSPEGKEIAFDADGLFARVLQHEIDHLNGVLFIDHLEEYVRKELTSELKRIKKLNREI